MRIYNTLTRQKDEFTVEGNEVKIYACGPTVYNFIHIGNARPLCVFDVLRRYLEFKGMKTVFVQNFTDVDDKMIKKANDEGVGIEEIADRYIAEYWKDAKGLNVRDATFHPKATENIDGMLEIIDTLMSEGHAYAVDNGDVYFRARSFSEYGKLSNQRLDDLEAGARVDVGEVKEDPMDFALWKSAKPGEPKWPSKYGEGRPGWHIECSAMARRYLGDTVDIHCGGQDLIFPHHENEIAQSECCTGETFARYWMHNGYINIDNRKMSKSLGNFFTVREISEEYGYEPIRYLMISSHYRSPINYSTDVIEQCINSLERLYNCRENLTLSIQNANGEDSGLQSSADERKKQYIKAMEDDLNTADALSAVFELARDINSASGQSKESLEYAARVFDELCGVLGLLYGRKRDEEIPLEILELAKKRDEARVGRDYKSADELRNRIQSEGYVVEDTPGGTVVKRERG